MRESAGWETHGHDHIDDDDDDDLSDDDHDDNVFAFIWDKRAGPGDTAGWYRHQPDMSTSLNYISSYFWQETDKYKWNYENPHGLPITIFKSWFDCLIM